jgi:hypothetical protein
MTDPNDTEVGGPDQECYPGNTCDDGLTCVQAPIDGGYDGGQCFDLSIKDAPDETNPDTGMADSPSDAVKVETGADAGGPEVDAPSEAAGDSVASG